MTPTPPDKDELTQKIYEAMQIPYLSERHDAINRLIASKVEEARAECLCKDVDSQTYQHVVSMRPPFECEWEKTSKKNGREFRGIPIDICIATEIAELWHQGVVTLNSCCGHRKVRASVVVSDSEHEKLEQLGYTDWEVCPSGLRQYFLRTGALHPKEGDS